MQSLFPGSAQPSAAPLVQFRAGKCALSSVQANGKYRVTSDPRPGKISLVKGDDGLMHFKWLNGLTNAVEDDRIVFPGEYVFKRVKTGRENCTDRVYMLKYQSGSQRLMYWLQDKSTEKDEETVKKVNDFLLNPNAVPAPASSTAGAAPAQGAVSPEEWMRLIGLNGGGNLPVPNAPAPAASAPAAQPPAALGNLDLSQILRTLAENSNAGAAGSGSAAAPAAPANPQNSASSNSQGGNQQRGEHSGSEGANGDGSGSNNNNNDGNDRMEE